MYFFSKRRTGLQRQHCFVSRGSCSLIIVLFKSLCEVHTKWSGPLTNFTWRRGGQTATGHVICLAAWMDDRMAGCLADVCPPLTYSHSVILGYAFFLMVDLFCRMILRKGDCILLKRISVMIDSVVKW